MTFLKIINITKIINNIFDKLINKKALIIIDDTFRMAVDIIKLPK